MSSASEKEQEQFNIKLGKAIIAGLTGFIVICSALAMVHAWFIQPQFSELQKRQEAQALEIKEVQRVQNGQERNIAVILEKLGHVDENVKDIKAALRK